MNLSDREIEDKAEETIREAGGDWEAAVSLFHDRVKEDAQLRESLMAKAVLDELRVASRRLGESTKKCQFCSEIIALDASKCKFCGEWVSGSPFKSVPMPPPKPPSSAPIIRNFTLLTGWILIVLIVILIISFAT